MRKARARLVLIALLAVAAAMPAAPVFARDSRRALSAARRSFDAGLMPEARSKLERYLVVYPDTSHLSEVLSLLCSVYSAELDFEGGLEYLDSLSKRLTEPGAKAALSYARADLLFRHEEYAKALDLLTMLLPEIPADSPDYGRVRFLYAATLFHSGLFDQAEPIFSELESNPDFGVKSSLYLSECLLELGRYDTSRKVLSRVLSGQSSSELYPYSLFLSGKLDYIEGRPGDAEEAFVKADAADTGGLLRPRMSFDRAMLYRRFSRFDLSNQQLELLRENSMYRTEADLMYVRNLISQGKYDEAITEVSECIGQYHPDAVADLLFWKGEAYICKESWAEAMDVYNGIIASFADFGLADECYYRVGYCLMRLNRHAEAVDLFARRLPLVGKKDMHLVFTRSIAECYFRLGQFMLSARFYTDAAGLAADEDGADELRLLAGRAYYNVGDWNNALKVWLDIAGRSANPGLRLGSVYSSGWVYFRQNDFPHAFGQFKTVARQLDFPLLKVKALFQMGNLYFYQGRYLLAVRYYRKIARFFPDTDRKISEFALFRAGYCLGRTGDARGAYATLDELVSRFPDSRYCPQIHFSLGCQDYNRGDYYRAYRRFSAVTTKFPDSELAPDASFWLAKSIAATGNAARAVGVLDKLIAGGRKSNFQAEAELMDARLLAGLGQTGRAVEILGRSAAETSLPFVRNQALLELGNIEFEQGGFVKAMDYYDRIPEDAAGPVLAQSGYNRGRALLALGRDDEALDAFTGVVFGLPACEKWVLASALEAGQVMEKKGRSKDAFLLYTKVKNDYVSGTAKIERRLEALKSKISSE